VGDLHHLHDAHEQARMLLPWHVNGTLEPAEQAWFEAHLAQCAECRAELEAELKLRESVATMPTGIAPIRVPVFDRIAPQTAAPRPWDFLRRRITFGWALAGQAAVAAAAVALVLVLIPTSSDREYQLLGSEAETAHGNAIVLFAPETTERELRDALTDSGARLVDGPTASGAYVVQVADADRSAALDELRKLPQVILAEPIDAGGAP
jgi:anti-sigma factor RsiW